MDYNRCLAGHKQGAKMGNTWGYLLKECGQGGTWWKSGTEVWS